MLIVGLIVLVQKPGLRGQHTSLPWLLSVGEQKDMVYQPKSRPNSRTITANHEVRWPHRWKDKIFQKATY